MLLKRLLISLALLLSIASHSYAWDLAHPPGDTDKVLHVAWGAGTEALTSALFTSIGVEAAPEIGLAAAVVTGITKELADKNFDYLDAVATIGGGLLAYVVDKNVRVYVLPSKYGGTINTHILF